MNKFIGDFLTAFVAILVGLGALTVFITVLIWMMATFSVVGWILTFIGMFALMYAIGESQDS